jgi:S-adenosylmethionine uptake transporter
MQSKFLVGVTWFILSLIVSNINDILTKYLGNRLNPMEVVFFRCAFGVLTLLPFMLRQGPAAFKTTRLHMHLARGILLFLAISMWCYGLAVVPVSTGTIISFTVPLFVLLMAPSFLNEKVEWSLWTATIIGFIGVIIVINPTDISFNPMVLLMLLSSLFFASLDIINKKFVAKESMLSMLFYSALVTTTLSLYPVSHVWQTPTSNEVVWLLLLGAGSNLILYCLLKAFSATAASSLAPYRYLELLLSILMGYLVFGDMPRIATIIGAAIVIPSTLFVAHQQIRKEHSKRKKITA